MRAYLLLICIFLLGWAKLSAQVFDFIVAKDGSGTHTTVQAAVDACPDDVKKLIFIKNGTYQEKVTIGVHATESNKRLSITGESAEGVIITWDDYTGKIVDGKSMGGQDCGSFIVNSKDFYAENLTFRNTYTDKQAIALYSVADRQTYKNCRILGWQDTHRLRKGRRYYFYDCHIEGAVDYIYSGGPAIFDKCRLHTIRDGGFITAPEDVTYITSANGRRYINCFVFRDCLLTTVGNYKYYLGRPWGPDAGAVFINAKMQGVRNEGWTIMGNDTYKSSFFAEYNSMDMNGNPMDISKRINWSYQLTKEEVDTYYTPEKIYSVVSGAFDPFTLVIAPDKPSNVNIAGNAMKWNAVNNAKGYIIYEDNIIIGFSTFAEFAHTTLSEKTYSVRTVGQHGNLSEAGKVGDATGLPYVKLIENEIYVQDGILHLPENTTTEIYATYGSLINRSSLDKEVNMLSYSKGIYIVKVITVNNTTVYKKIIL